MAFNLATLFVSIKADDSAFSRSLSGIRSSLVSAGSGIGGVLGGAFAAPLRAADSLANVVGKIGVGAAIGGVTAAVGGLAVAAYKGVSGAMSLQDTMSATDAIFGSSSGVIFKWADDMASKFGAVKNETILAAQQFGASFKAIGKSPDEAAALGTQLAKLGMDLASFSGTSNEQAFTALNAALRGEFDPLERFNIQLTAASISEEAMRMGLVKSAKEMDESAKKTAALSLIMKKSADQQGDLERTSDQSSNTWKKLTGTLENLATDVGTVLMPALTAVMQLGADAAVGLASAFESNKGMIIGWGQTIIGWVNDAQLVFRNLGDIWQMVTVQASAGFINFLNVLAVIPANVAIIGKYIADNWYQLIYDGVSASIVVFQNFAENLRRIVEAVWEYMRNPAGGFRVDFKPLLEGFAATSAALPELVKPAVVDATEQLAAIQDRIASREAARQTGVQADRAAKAAEAVSKPAQQAAKMAADRESKFKSQAFDSEDFYYKLREEALSGKDDTQKEQLAASKKTAENTQKIADKIDRGMVARLA